MDGDVATGHNARQHVPNKTRRPLRVIVLLCLIVWALLTFTLVFMIIPGTLNPQVVREADMEYETKPEEPNCTETRQLGLALIEREEVEFAPWCSGSRKPPTSSAPVHEDKDNTNGRKYFLTAVLVVRIYNTDFTSMTTREMMQWLQFVGYSGVEHVYVYDAFLHKNESQRKNLNCFIENGFVTYVSWGHKTVPIRGEVARNTQVPAYRDCLDRFGHEFTWQMAIDIDEYPYCPHDKSPGFLLRFIEKTLQNSKNNIGQILMPNFLFLGEPLNSTEHPLLIDRNQRRTIRPWNNHVKPIFLGRSVRVAFVHRNVLRTGYVRHFPDIDEVRMYHYHGNRRNYSRSVVLRVTKEDRGMQTAVSALEPCLKGCAYGCC